MLTDRRGDITKLYMQYSLEDSAVTIFQKQLLLLAINKFSALQNIHICVKLYILYVLLYRKILIIIKVIYRCLR